MYSLTVLSTNCCPLPPLRIGANSLVFLYFAFLYFCICCWFCSIDSCVQQQQAGVQLECHLYRCQRHQSCHLPAQKRPPLLNRSGDKMDYRSFIRALKFQNRTRPSADGLLCFQNSFRRLVLLQSAGDSTEIWWRCWCFWLSSNPLSPMRGGQRPNIDKGRPHVDLRQRIKHLLKESQCREYHKKLL